MNTALSLDRRRVFRTLALWLGLAALMVQGLAPLCAVGPMGASGRASGVASIVLCTAHGFETVQIGADGKPLPNQPANTASDCCTACHAPVGFTLPAPILAALPSAIAYDGAHLVTAPVPTARFYSSYVTRGPPAAIRIEFA